MSTFNHQQVSSDVVSTPLEEMPIPASHQLPAVTVSSIQQPLMEKILQSYAEYVGKVIAITARQLRRTSREVGRGTGSAYSEATHLAEDITVLTRRQVKVIKRDYPLEALGILAGAGILAGFALRIWRSHES